MSLRALARRIFGRNDPPARESCSTCRYRGWTGTQFYDCRRHAPIAKDEPQRRGGITEPHWPMVEGHHWCGDYSPSREREAA